MMTKISHALCALALGAAVAVTSGCASKDANLKPFKPGSGIAEYRAIVETAARALQGALSALDQVAAQSNRCSPDALRALDRSVQQLQVESLQVRARAQAILARGDAYFENWEDTLKRVKDPGVRARIEKNHAPLQRRFEAIKNSSTQFRSTFKPFFSDLRELRNSLESDPANLSKPAGQDLLARTSAQGKQLLPQLSIITRELDAMKALLMPADTK
jgi:hypothetical protein